MANPKWLEWAQRLQGLAQTGLAFSGNPYDLERYKAVGEIAAEMASTHSGKEIETYRDLYNSQTGYATPKLDVRGAVFQDDKILMVRELMDEGRWTLPGGFVDVNDSPGAAVEREVWEESGYKVHAYKLAAVYDRNLHPHPPYLFHIYKLFFLCEMLGGEPTNSHETADARFFAVDQMPILSLARVTPDEIERMFIHFHTPDQPTEFD
jgi:ADP-ribose pyrophosphatase YjhB (NUDIX family)